MSSNSLPPQGGGPAKPGGGSTALAAVFTLLALPAPVAAAPLPDDMSLGSSRAPVTVIEYASVGCPHCATWSREVFPAFKKRFIDTGRVRFVLREMMNGDPDVAAAGFLTARCAGPAHYFQVVEGLFDAEPQIERDQDDMPSLLKVAGEAGLSKTQVADCLSDHAALNDLEKRVQAHTEVDHVNGTPTFDINGKRLDGEQPLDKLAEAIDQAGRHPVTRRR